MSTFSTSFGHSLAIRDDGVTMAWGRNHRGQLGDGTTTSRNVPVVVAGGHEFVSVSAGLNHSMALDTQGRVWAWGLCNFDQGGSSNYLGNGLANTTPELIEDLGGAPAFCRQIEAGNWASYCLSGPGNAFLSDRRLAFFGRDSVMNLDSFISETATTAFHQLYPAQKSGVQGVPFQQVSSGFKHLVMLDVGGTAWTYGRGEFGALGNGTESDSALLCDGDASALDSCYVPTPVPFSERFRTIEAAPYGGGGITHDGRVFVWGGGVEDSAFAEEYTLSPVPIPFFEGVPIHWMALGRSRAFYVSDNRFLFRRLWGSDEYQYVSPGPFDSVACKDLTGLLLRSDGVMLATGFNAFGNWGAGPDYDMIGSSDDIVPVFGNYRWKLNSDPRPSFWTRVDNCSVTL